MWRRGGSECEAGFLYLEMYVIVFGCSTLYVVDETLFKENYVKLVTDRLINNNKF